ncbi:MAG: hypothetical protein ACE5HE_13920 [Phycisphaerae bacterium]
MTTTASDSPFRAEQNTDDSIKASLSLLESMLDEAADHLFDADYFEEIGRELRRLHARIRMHHAADYVGASPDDPNALPPELSEELNRLRAEHPLFLGQLDRLVRSVDAMADRSLEDKEVFILRARELIAMLRRHEAEEDRLFYLAVWRDTGGES